MALYAVFTSERDDTHTVKFGAEIVIGTVAAEFFREGQRSVKTGGADVSQMEKFLSMG